MAKRLAFAIPGDLGTWTGGYVYDRRIIAELRRLGWLVDVVNLGEGFPLPGEERLAAATRQLAAASVGCPIVIDGLALGVLPKAAKSLHSSRSVVALVHHPLALETGLASRTADEFRASERDALASAHIVIATSDATADLLGNHYDVPRERLRVIEPGTDRVLQSIGKRSGGLELLSVGAIGRRKGFDVLVDALSQLTDIPWRLTIVGDRSRDTDAVERLEALIIERRLADRIRLPGAVSSDRLAEHYARADLFVLASHFEGYGMAFAEAIAHGLPIVGTTGGAIFRTVGAAASRLVPPGNADMLAKALRDVMTNEDCRRALAAGARAAAATLPTWVQSGERFSRVLDDLP